MSERTLRWLAWPRASRHTLFYGFHGPDGAGPILGMVRALSEVCWLYEYRIFPVFPRQPVARGVTGGLANAMACVERVLHGELKETYRLPEEER